MLKDSVHTTNVHISTYENTESVGKGHKFEQDLVGSR